MLRPLLILDFDGTLCLGDGPVRAYGLEVAREAGHDPREIAEALDGFFGVAGDVGELGGTPDGYTAVARWGRARGLDEVALSRAFHRSRPAVERGDVPVYAPEGAVDLLDQWRHCDRVLVTNAPQSGTEVLVERLGLRGVLDHIVDDAAKPAGLSRMLSPGGALEAEHRPLIVSVGDIWVNDLAPVAGLGGITGLIERHPQIDATPTVRAGDIQQVFERLRAFRDGDSAGS